MGHASEQGLSELVSRGERAILDANRHEAREHLSRFFAGLAGDEPVTYGTENVAQAIEYGAVETVLVSDDLPTEEIREYEQRVEGFGGELIVIGSDFEKGEQLATVFDGVAGLLRFPIE